MTNFWRIFHFFEGKSGHPILKKHPQIFFGRETIVFLPSIEKKWPPDIHGTPAFCTWVPLRCPRLTGPRVLRFKIEKTMEKNCSGPQNIAPHSAGIFSAFGAPQYEKAPKNWFLCQILKACCFWVSVHSLQTSGGREAAGRRYFFVGRAAAGVSVWHFLWK